MITNINEDLIEIIEIPHETIPHYVESQKREGGYILRDGINVPSKYIK